MTTTTGGIAGFPDKGFVKKFKRDSVSLANQANAIKSRKPQPVVKEKPSENTSSRLRGRGGRSGR